MLLADSGHRDACNLRASMWWQFLFFGLLSLSRLLLAVDGLCSQTLEIVFIDTVRFLVVMLSSSRTFSEAENTLVGVQGRDIIPRVDSRGGVGDQVVSCTVESLHDASRRVSEVLGGEDRGVLLCLTR